MPLSQAENDWGIWSAKLHKESEVDGDGRIGLQEVIYILQNIDGLM